MYDNPSNRARDWAEDWQHRAAKKLEETQAMAARLEKLSITTGNDDKSVTITVDASGVMTGLDLTPAATRLSPADLAAEILAVQRKAHNALGKGASLVVKDTVGLETPTGEAVMAGYRKRFGKKALAERDEQRRKDAS